MRCCVLLLASCLTLTPLAAGAQDSAAHQFCRMSWASQPAKMSACVEGQIAGAQSVIRWLEWAKSSADPAALFIITTFEACSERWTPDFQRIEACLRAESPLAPPSG